MVTKNDENVVVVKSATELQEIDRERYQFTAKKVFREWKEEFVDESTGLVTPVTRTEILFDKGVILTPDDFSKLLFHFQCNDLGEVCLSDQQRQATLVNNRGFGLWVVKAVGSKFKPKMMLRATNAMNAYEVAKDYIELNYTGDFFIKSMRTYDDCIIIEPNQEEEVKDVMKSWYEVSLWLVIQNEDGEEEESQPYVFIVYAETVEAAKATIENWLANKRSEDGVEGKYTLKMQSATTIGANVIVPMEFCLAYRKGGEE